MNQEEYPSGELIEVELEVTNQGDRPGQEVVQLYLRDVQSSLVRPPKALRAFSKISLGPGETQSVKLTLQEEDLAFYDDGRAERVVEPGEFEVLVGRSAGDIRLVKSFQWGEA